MLRTVFAGTPAFACPSLDALLKRADIDVVAVYTQPDRRAGRGRKPGLSPVKALATEAGLRVEQPEHLRSPAALETFSALAPQLFVVAAYGLILPPAVLDVARASINVHASLLPRWRGAAPIERAIMAGDERTGISIMRIVEQLDAGPVWCVRECAISPDETGASLHDKLATLGAVALDAALDDLVAERVVETPQDDALSTYAHKLTPADRDIDWQQPAFVIERQVRALAPRPGARAELGGMELKLLGATVLPDTAAGATAGSVLACTNDGLDVACGDGVLRIHRLQPAGRQVLDAAAFCNGYGKQF